MNTLIKFLKFLFCILLFVSAKIISESVVVHNYLFFVILEILVLYILSAFFLFVTDLSRSDEVDKIVSSTVMGGLFSIFVLILTILKSWVYVWIMNYCIFCLFFAMPFIRDYWYYNGDSKRSKIVLLVLLSTLTIYKLVLNLFNLFNPDIDKSFNLISIGFLPFVYFFVRAAVNSFFVNGTIDYDGKEYYILESLKVGRNKNSDIYLPEVNSSKSNLFSITATGNKLFIKGDENIKVENKQLKGKTELNDGDTIKGGSEYFTISTGRGFFHKRLIALFFFIFIINIIIFADQDVNSFVDFSTYPDMRIYAQATKYDAQSPIFLVEGDDSINYKKLKLNCSFDIDLFLILDATGNMTDRYRSFSKYADKIFKETADSGKNMRVHIVTFADDKTDLHYMGGVTDQYSFNNKINQIRNIPGNDFKENPLDAIFSTNNILEDTDNLKVFILFTDAPPHVKGDRGKEGVIDFTEKTVNDTKKFIRDNNILFYTASYQRYTEYIPFYEDNPANFFDIENVDDIGSIIYSITHKLSSTIMVEYKATKNKNYITEVAVFSGDDALYEQKNYKIKRIKKRSFMRSLFEVF